MDFWYYLQQSHVRKAAHLGNRTLSDGVDIYRAMLEDTMQTAKPQLIEVMENYKVCILLCTTILTITMNTQAGMEYIFSFCAYNIWPLK